MFRPPCLALLVALSAQLAMPQSLAQSNDKRPMVEWSDRFVQFLNDGKAAPAGQMLIDRFQKDWKGTDRVPSPEELGGFVYGFMSRAEPGLGSERIDEGHVGSSIFRLIYIVKQSSAVGVVRIWFYRPEEEWKLSDFEFDFTDIAQIEDFL